MLLLLLNVVTQTHSHHFVSSKIFVTAWTSMLDLLKIRNTKWYAATQPREADNKSGRIYCNSIFKIILFHFSIIVLENQYLIAKNK